MPGFGICGSGGTISNTLETARRHRFEWTIFTGPSSAVPLSSDLGVKDILVLCHKAGRPSIEIDKITVHRGQDEIYVPGKQRWNSIEISFYEAVKDGGNPNDGVVFEQECGISMQQGKVNSLNAVSSVIHDWWAVNVIDTENSRLQRKYKSICNLEMLDGRGNTIWRYKIYGSWPGKVSPNDLDYGDSSICFIVQDLGAGAPSEPLLYYKYTWEITSLFEDPVSANDYSLVYIRDATTPTFTLGKEEVAGASLKYKYAKDISWDDIKLTWYDVDGLWRKIKAWRERVWTPEGGIGFANDYKRESVLTSFVYDETLGMRWRLFNSWPSTVKTGELTYTDSNIKTVDVSITYDWAEEEETSQSTNSTVLTSR